MQCPKCQGPTYDNRAENDQRVAKGEKMRPDFKCKDKNCDGVLWRPKEGWGAAPAPAPTTAKQGFSAGPHIPAIDGEHPALPHEKLDMICAASKAFLGHVLSTEIPELVKAQIGASDTYVHARVANLLITAEKAGVFR